MKTKNKALTKHLDFLIIDIISLIISFLIAYRIKIGSFSMFLDSEFYRTTLVYLILITLVVSYFYEPYKNILKRHFLKDITTNIVYVFIIFALLSFVLFLTKRSTEMSRLLYTYSLVFTILISSVLKLINKLVIHKRSELSIKTGRKTVLILSKYNDLNKLLHNISKYNYDMYKVIGICIYDKKLENTKYEGYDVVCDSDTLLSYICHNWVDEIFVNMNINTLPKDIIKAFATTGITTNYIINTNLDFGNQEQHFNNMFNHTVLTSSIKLRSPAQVFIKKMTDILGGLVGSLITLMLALIIGPIIYIKSPGPIFYKQDRIGLNGKIFKMYKFRSMVLNADDLKKDLLKQNRVKDGMMFKIKDDPRIIPGIGSFIRKTSLDEFPQFFNVLKGDMSLVGTRPPTLDEWQKYGLEHRIRMSITPGITGMWQTSGRNKITDFNKVIEFDTEYINNWSLTLDFNILFKTVLVLFSKREEDEVM